MRRATRVQGLSVASAFLIFAGSSVCSAEALSQETAEATVAALAAGIEVEREVLKAQQELYRRAAADRDAATRRLQDLIVEFDSLVQSSEPGPPEQVAAKDREVSEAERQRSGAIERGREVRGRIQEIQERIAGLEKKVASLKESLPKTRETLTGSWQITYLPGANRGTLVLRQTGTIVQGQYQLDGGWKGSLQGTFVDGKVYLQRIDSKLGRSGELQGYLSFDGKSIRGTWQNYNLTDGGASAGSWTASRQED